MTYHTVTSDDTIILCRKYANDKYHVDVDLLLALPETLAPYSQLADVPKFFLSPHSRYLTGSCCEDPDHALNGQEAVLENHSQRG